MAFEKPSSKLEILRYIAMNGPCKSSLLRQQSTSPSKKHWSSRTVAKHVPILQELGFIVKTKDGYDITDLGFHCVLLHAISAVSDETTAKEVSTMMKRA